MNQKAHVQRFSTEGLVRRPYRTRAEHLAQLCTFVKTRDRALTFLANFWFADSTIGCHAIPGVARSLDLPGWREGLV